MNSEQNKSQKESILFFHNKLGNEFSVGLHEISNPIIAVSSLKRLFEKSETNEFIEKWLCRGGRSIGIREFENMSETKVLLENKYEFEIDKIAVYVSETGFDDFVYLLCKPKKVVFNEVNQRTDEREYLSAYNGKYYPWCEDLVVELEDGSSAKGTLRYNYIKAMNYLIVAQGSKINCIDEGDILKNEMERLLINTDDISRLIEIVHRLPEKQTGIIVVAKSKIEEVTVP